MKLSHFSFRRDNFNPVNKQVQGENHVFDKQVNFLICDCSFRNLLKSVQASYQNSATCRVLSKWTYFVVWECCFSQNKRTYEEIRLYRPFPREFQEFLCPTYLTPQQESAPRRPIWIWNVCHSLLAWQIPKYFVMWVPWTSIIQILEFEIFTFSKFW